MSKQRVLVTGGRGTLGSELVPRLQQNGYRVRITSRQTRPDNLGAGLEWAQASMEASKGWDAALADVDTVVHAATSPFKRGADVEGTRRLLGHAAQAGVGHIVYISIVGVDKKDWFYYEDKFESEQLIAQSGIGFSILRATQFHDFIHRLLDEMFLRLPIGFLPRNWRMQPIDTGEVADLLLDVVQRGPGGHLPEVGGPEILDFGEMANVWMDVHGRRPVIRVPFPFLMGRAFTTDHVLTPQRRVGQRTWRQWVHAGQPAPNHARA